LADRLAISGTLARTNTAAIGEVVDDQLGRDVEHELVADHAAPPCGSGLLSSLAP